MQREPEGRRETRPPGTQPVAPSFEELAGDYDRLRPADEGWQEVVDAVWEEGDLLGRRVLDVGCGTGRVARALAERGARVWGVDPSPAMLEQARRRCGRSVGLKPGRAEDLPFRDGWFERAILHLVVHLVDRERAFRELARVLAPGGRVVVATFAPSHFEGFWLARYFPSLAEIDRRRFVDPARLADELATCGFRRLRLRGLHQERQIARGEALERIRGRFISTLRLVPDDEYRAGLARAELELSEVTSYTREWTIVSGELG